MEQPNPATLKRYCDAAAAIGAQLDALQASEPRAAAAAGYRCTGRISSDLAFVYQDFRAALLEFDNGVCLSNEGRLCGVSDLAVTWGGGVFYVDPESLDGVEVDTHVGVLLGGAIGVTWRRDDKKIGEFIAVHLGAGATAMGGKTRFRIQRGGAGS